MILAHNEIGIPGAVILMMTKTSPSLHSNHAVISGPVVVSKTSSAVERGTKPRILLSDDQHDVLTALELLLKLHGYSTQRADSPSQLLRLSEQGEFDLILMDLNYTRDTTSGQEGLELLQKLRQKHSASPILVMTAWGNIELAVEAMRLGASDFVQKPWDNARLLQTLSKGLEQSVEARRVEARTRSEVEIARHVHQKLFPNRLKALSRLDYGGRCIPAREVGGDYYDFFDTGEGHLAFIVADVSGKGVAAAMLMANLQACLRTQFESGVRDPLELLKQANRLFFESTPPSQYVTLFYGDYDQEKRELEYLSCGHPSPVLVRQDGSVTRPQSTATVLGLFPDWHSAASETIRFAPGDLLVAFTDGITDAIVADGEELGEERLVDFVAKLGNTPAESCITAILEMTESGSSFGQSFDDRTLVTLRAL